MEQSAGRLRTRDAIGRVRVGISSCLLGRRVRHDGGHKRHEFLSETLGRHVHLVPVCPEVEIGLGTPRLPIRLERANGIVRLIEPESGADLTGPMDAFAAARVQELGDAGLAGFVLKSRSPSCGLAVAVTETTAAAAEATTGRFARALVECLPELPVVEETALDDTDWREAFVLRVFTYHRWCAAREDGWTVDALREFHGRHRTLFAAMSPPSIGELDAIAKGAVAVAAATDEAERYGVLWSSALAVPPDRRGHVEALESAVRRIASRIGPDATRTISARIHDYAARRIPRIVPLSGLREAAERAGSEELYGDLYFDPPSAELALIGRL